MKFHHRAVPIVIAAVLIDSIGFGIVLPVLPRLIVSLAHVGLSDAARIGGYMLVAFSAAQFFAAPVLGSLGDSVGRRPVLLFSMLAFSADYAFQAAAPSIGWLFAGRLIAGVAGATYGPANAVLADVTPPERRGAVFGLMGAGEERTVVIGMATGGCAFLAYVFARQEWMIYAILVLGSLQALTFPSVNALLSRLTDASHQGALMGGMQSLSSIAWIIAPFALSQSLAFGAERGFTGGNFALAALFVFAALAIVLLRVVPRVSRGPVPVA